MTAGRVGVYASRLGEHLPAWAVRRIVHPSDSTASSEVHAIRHPHGIFEIHLAGGHKRNALGRATVDRIESLACVPPLGTKVILITAEYPDFCAGYDLLEASRTGPESLIAHNGNFSFLRRVGIPVVAVLHGNVIGGGLELALAADVRLATADTKFAIPANRLGLVYSEQGVRLLVQELGESTTRAMLLGGKTLSAEEARALGVVAEVHERDAIEARALELAATISSWPALATSGNRRVIDAVVGRTEEDLDALHLASFASDGELAAAIERFVARQNAPAAPKTRPVDALRHLAVHAGSRLKAGRVGFGQLRHERSAASSRKRRYAHVTPGDTD